MLKLVRILLSPLAVVFSYVIMTRNWLFDKNIFKVSKVDAKIISVGNLTVGGSGKTPTVMMVANILKSRNKKIGLLSRGYGRKSYGYVYVSNGKKILCSVDECGDEMFFMSDELKVPTAVAERRVDGAKRFIKDSNADVVILDDAFQHRWIHRNVDIVVIDQRFLLNAGQIEQKMLPLGLMREPFNSLEGADVIIINRKFSKKEDIPEKLKKYFMNKQVFTGYYIEEGIYDVKTHHFFDINEFQGQKSLVVCGIANPESVLKVFGKNHIDVANKMIFTDHKNYTMKEVQNIRKKFYDTNSYSVLTTQKDAVKFIKYSKELDDIDIYYLKIELKVDEHEKFDQVILNSIN